LAIYAICLGALGFLNTWDFPIYLFLVVAAFALRRWQETGKLDTPLLIELVVLGATLGAVGFALYLPFYLSFQSQARGILPNLFNGTRFSQFFVMFGQFIVPGALFIVALAATRARASAWEFWSKALSWAVTILVAASLAGLALGFTSPNARTTLQAWLSNQPVPGLDPNLGGSVGGRLLQRLFDPWTPLLLALALVTIWIVWERINQPAQQPVNPSTQQQPGDEPAEESQESLPFTQPGVPFVLLLFFIGALLAIAVEFIYLNDLFGTRMNTVFKFYYQVWALWGVAAACALGLMLRDADLWKPFRIGTGIVCALLIAAGLAYPLIAFATVGDPALSTLDGAAWVEQASPDDYAGIQWLNRNVQDAPVILEAPGLSYHSELSRISAFTGLPTVLGWTFTKSSGAAIIRRRGVANRRLNGSMPLATLKKP